MLARTLAVLVAAAACTPGQPPAPVAPAAAGTPAELRRDGDQLYEAKRFADAARAYARAIELGDTNIDIAYNAACSFALAGQRDTAFRYLDRAIAGGYADVDFTEQDSDLDPLHGDPRWAKAVERIAAERAKAAAREAAEEARLADLTAHAVLPVLTRDQMYADFDALVKTVTEISPQTALRKAVTGIDPLAELAAMRPQIETLRSTEDFALLVRSALVAFQDGHTSLLGAGFQRATELKRLGVSDQAVALAGKYGQLYDDRDAGKRLALPIKYLAGEYFLFGDVHHAGKLAPRGSRITHANGEPIHAFVAQLYRYTPMMRWDFERGRYYSERFYTSHRFTRDDTIALTFAPPTGKPVTIELPQREPVAFAPAAPDAKRIEWIDELGVLYVRMPEMAVEDTAWYPRAIKDAARGHQVRKVVFDIRNNGGGSDDVWMRALAAVIPRPLEYTITFGYNASPASVERQHLESAPVLRPPFLPGATLRTRDGLHQRIAPDVDSINFAGRIYVLQNANIFSSAGGFAAAAVRADNMVTVGARTGWLLGLGVNPIVFELPQSRLLYRVEPALDLTGVKTAADAYHDTVELPVEPTLDAAIERFAYHGDPFARPFLTASDPVFRAAVADGPR